MNREEKKTFIVSLCNSVRDDLLSKIDRMPEGWDGHELRELISDAFLSCTSLRRPRGKRGLREYRNVVTEGTMRQAIVTKYHWPTDTKGSRVSARCQAKRIFVSWDDSLNVDANHATAARMLVEKMGWGGKWHAGGLPCGSGNVFVCDDCGPDFVTVAKSSK